MVRRPPVPVWIAVAALGVVILVQVALAIFFAGGSVAGWWRFGFAVALFGALAAGLVRGARLAWLWVRSLALVLGVVVLAGAAAKLVHHEIPWQAGALALVTGVIPLLTAYWVLGRPAVFEFFGLVCPVCGQRSSFGADFLFRKARCRRCQHEW